MEEGLIAITQLNDFVFCPASIYFHKLYGNEETRLYQRTDQVDGKAAHSSVDKGYYSTRKSIIMGLDVYSDEYGLIGKIDIFNIITGQLTERKKKIHKVYDGFIFQVYAQTVCLSEMGYDVRSIVLYSMDDNRKYSIKIPKEDNSMWKRFLKTIADIRAFEMSEFVQNNIEKCKGCIYEPLCDRSLL